MTPEKSIQIISEGISRCRKDIEKNGGNSLFVYHKTADKCFISRILEQLYNRMTLYHRNSSGICYATTVWQYFNR